MSDKSSYPACAAWARELGVEPTGTAPQFDVLVLVLVLVEHPLPWPRDVLSDPSSAVWLRSPPTTSRKEGRCGFSPLPSLANCGSARSSCSIGERELLGATAGVRALLRRTVWRNWSAIW